MQPVHRGAKEGFAHTPGEVAIGGHAAQERDLRGPRGNRTRDHGHNDHRQNRDIKDGSQFLHQREQAIGGIGDHRSEAHRKNGEEHTKDLADQNHPSAISFGVDNTLINIETEEGGTAVERTVE